VTDYVNNTASIKVTPTGKNVILTTTTGTGKYQSLTLTANDAPVVSGIKGVKSSFVTMLANDTTLNTVLNGKVDFIDQYGDVIAAPAFDGTDATAALDYTIAAKDANNAVTTAVTPGTIVSSTTAGTETYVVTLKNAAGTVLDTKEVTVTVVDKTKIAEFGIKDLNKFHTAASAAHAQNVDIYGVVDGKQVVVNQNMAINFLASNGLAGINPTTGEYTPTAVATTEDKTSTIRVLVEAGDKTYTITKDVVYSSAAPKAAALDIELDGAAAAGVVQITPANNDNIVTTGTDGLNIFATDQYGVAIESGYTFVVSNNTTGANIAISGTGVLSVTDANGNPVALTAGKSFQINVTINGVTKSVRVIVG
jgi:hypothetical protein